MDVYMRTIRQCYEAYNNGNKLNDEELERFTLHMELTTEQLELIGPEFKIVANHCRKVAQRNRNYMNVRRLIQFDIDS